MCLLYMWPSAKIAVMGGEQAAGVLVQVKSEQLKRKGLSLSAEEEEKMRSTIVDGYEK